MYKSLVLSASLAAALAAWQALGADRRNAISRVFANMGKAIAAFEQTLAYAPARFDRYAEAVAGKDAAADRLLASQEVNGLRLFIGKGQCVTCHNGPLLTDQAFHNTGVPPRDAARPDAGRPRPDARVKPNELQFPRPVPPAAPPACQELAYLVADGKELEAAFKAPSLRNLAARPPYMHAGQFPGLGEVIAHYVKARRRRWVTRNWRARTGIARNARRSACPVARSMTWSRS